MTRLRYNDPAPDLELLTVSGRRIRLAALWEKQPLLLAFTRHLGCPQCKEMLFELRQAQAEIEKAGLKLAAITQGTPEQTAQFAAQYAPDVLCLADPQRQAYRAYKLERGNLWQVVLSPQVWRGTRRAQEHGYRPEMPPPGQDVVQMSGVFIIGRDGLVRLPFYYDTIADHPPVELLLHGVLGTRWDKGFGSPLA